MRDGRGLYLCMAILLAVAGRAATQHQKTPDPASKPLVKWIEALKDKENRELRLQARLALGPAGPYATEAVPALIDGFKVLPVGPRPVAPYESCSSLQASQTLADYGPAVIPVLVKALTRPEAKVRAGVAEALGYIRPRSVTVVPALIEAMKDSSPDVRARAASSLGRIGQAASRAVPSLVAALKDGHADVRAASARALSRMPREAQVPVDAVIPLLKDKDERVCDAAALALQRIGPNAKSAVPALIEALRNKKYPGSHSELATALGAIGPAAKQAVSVLVEVVEDHFQTQSSYDAALALGHIGPDARAAVPALIKVLKAAKNDDVNSYPDAAIFALGKIGPDAKAAVPLLIQAFNHERPEVGWAAAEALVAIGPEAKAAIPALTAIVREQKAGPWHDAAALALAKIDPKLAASKKFGLPTDTIRLGKIPSLKLAPRVALTQEREKYIKSLIAKLADVKDPDFGLSATLTGQAFAPLPGHYALHSGLLTNHGLKTADAFRSLVALGPDALPFLLEALEDGTPTKLTVTRRGLMGFGAYIEGNPLNEWETRVLTKSWTYEGKEDEPDLYSVKVGDVCFVAIGQIVGRQYLAVRYVPSAIILINSPVESDELRERVRAVWSSKDPARRLLESLLIDYATEGIYNGESLDGWADGSERQIAAAMRLLYYFPKEASPLISARLRSLEVRSRASDYDWAKREVKNGVRTADFIKAVAWSQAPAIREALADIAKRTDDETIRKALTPAK